MCIVLSFLVIPYLDCHSCPFYSLFYLDFPFNLTFTSLNYFKSVYLIHFLSIPIKPILESLSSRLSGGRVGRRPGRLGRGRCRRQQAAPREQQRGWQQPPEYLQHDSLLDRIGRDPRAPDRRCPRRVRGALVYGKPADGLAECADAERPHTTASERSMS